MSKKSLKNAIKSTFVIFMFSFLLSSCSSLDIVPNKTDRYKDIQAAKGNTLAVESVSLTDRFLEVFENNPNINFDKSITFEVVLQQFSIMPLLSVDRVGGVVITDWFSTSSNNNERVKFNIIIKDEKMENASIDINMFKEIFNGTSWTKAPVDKNTADKIKQIVLEKSRRLKATAELS